MSFKIIDHTADLALALSGATQEELLRSAVFGYTALLTDPDSLSCDVEREFKIGSDNPEGKLVLLINELIFLFETTGFIPKTCDIEVSGDDVFCKTSGEIYKQEKHELFHCIKSATYGGLEVVEKNGELTSTLILDD